MKNVQVSSVLSLILSDKRRNKIYKRLAKNPYNPYIFYEQKHFMAYAHDTIIRNLGPHILEELRDNGIHDYNSYGVIIIKNGPLDEIIGPTPLDNLPPKDKATFVTEGFIAGITQVFGIIFGYKNEKYGQLIHNICPSQLGRNAVSSEGAKRPFPWHVENANLYPYIPDLLSLYCLRNDKNKQAKTLALNPTNIINSMSEEEFNVLCRDRFQVGGNDSMGLSDPRIIRLPAIIKRDNFYELTVEFKDTKALDPVAEQVLEKFKRLCNASKDKIEINLEPGDLMIIDNRRVLHSRTSFEAEYNGEDRWLQRVYSKLSLFDTHWKEILVKNNLIINDEILK